MSLDSLQTLPIQAVCTQQSCSHHAQSYFVSEQSLRQSTFALGHPSERASLRSRDGLLPIVREQLGAISSTLWPALHRLRRCCSGSCTLFCAVRAWQRWRTQGRRHGRSCSVLARQRLRRCRRRHGRSCCRRLSCCLGNAHPTASTVVGSSEAHASLPLCAFAVHVRIVSEAVSAPRRQRLHHHHAAPCGGLSRRESCPKEKLLERLT